MPEIPTQHRSETALQPGLAPSLAVLIASAAVLAMLGPFVEQAFELLFVVWRQAPQELSDVLRHAG